MNQKAHTKLQMQRRQSLPVIAVFILLACLSAPSVMASIVDVRIESIAAIVNDDIITSLELEKEMQNLKLELGQQGMNFPSDEILKKQVLERMIIMRIQLQNAGHRNIRVDDEAVNASIENIAAKNKMDLLRFKEALESRGFNYTDYRERIRNEMIIGQLQKQQVNNTIIITEQEIDDFLANQALQGSDEDEYRLEHILVAVPEAANSEKIQAAKQRADSILQRLNSGADFAQLAIAESDGQQALQGGDLGWRKLIQIPTLFADLVRTMKVGEHTDLIRSPSGFHIIRVADKRHEKKQMIVKQTKARHILITTKGPESGNEAVTRLKQLKQRIDSGESFSELAAAHSDDKGSAARGGELGWISPGMLVPEFEEQMSNLQPGQVSEPFQTRYGWHIVQVEERRDFDNTQRFEREQAREALIKRKIEPAIENWVRRLRDESFVEVRI